MTTVGTCWRDGTDWDAPPGRDTIASPASETGPHDRPRQASADHGDHRPGRLLSRRAAARQGIRGPRPGPAIQHLLDRHASTTSTAIRMRPTSGCTSTTATCPIRRRSSTRSTGSSPTRSTTWAPRATSRSASRCRSSPPTRPAWARSACSRPSATPTGRSASTRPASSEMFGKVAEPIQSETTPFYPRSPYAVSKVFAHWMTIQYREAYGIFARQRHPVQPRVAAARRDVRDAQGDPRHRGDPGRHGGEAVPRATSTRGATGATPPSTSRRCG